MLHTPPHHKDLVSIVATVVVIVAMVTVTTMVTVMVMEHQAIFMATTGTPPVETTPSVLMDTVSKPTLVIHTTPTAMDTVPITTPAIPALVMETSTECMDPQAATSPVTVVTQVPMVPIALVIEPTELTTTTEQLTST